MTEQSDKSNRFIISQPSRRHIIESRYLVIKPISVNDITVQYLFWLNDPSINQFLEVRHQTSTFESVVAYINHTRSMKDCEFFAIFTKNENIHIGNINITSYNPHGIGYAQYGMMIGNKKAQQVGLGGVASIMIVEYLFADSQIRKIEVLPIAANEKSWKTTESLGFVKEGVLREHDILFSGELTDTYIYGLFRKEWDKKKSQFAGLLKDFRIEEF